MKKKSTVFVLALCPLLPVSAQFANSLIIALALLVYFLSGLLIRHIFSRINFEFSTFFFELTALSFSSALFYQILFLVFPLLAISLDLYIFISAISYILLVSIDSYQSKGFSFSPMFQFLPLFLLFSFLREILGKGTISLPTSLGILEFSVIPFFNTIGLGFWSSISGAFILLGFLTWIYKISMQKEQ